MSEQVRAAIRIYRALRDEEKKIKDRHKEELKQVQTNMNKIETKLHALLLRMGANHISTTDGTAYFTKRTTLTINDWETTLKEVVDNQLWHMLERRLAKSAVEQYVDAHKDNFPGTSITSELEVRIQANRGDSK